MIKATLFCLIILFLILFFLEIRAKRRQKSISVEFSFATVFSPHITLCNNKYSRADVQFFSITVRILALRDAFIKKKKNTEL